MEFIAVVLLVLAFYLLVMRPAQIRQRRAADIQEHLKPGVEIMTTAGMFGTVSRVEDDEFYLEIAPGVELKFVSAAVGKILLPKDETAGGDGEKSRKDAGKGFFGKKKLAADPPVASGDLGATAPDSGERAPERQDGDSRGPKSL